MQALHDVVKAGYARYIGVSSWYAWQCKCLSTRQSVRDQLTDLDLVHLMQREDPVRNLRTCC